MDLRRRVASIEKRLARRWPNTARYTRAGVTRLCLDGPPRSANSLLWHKIFLANRGPTFPAAAVAHHTHDYDSVLLAVLLGVPVVMPIREPLESLSSYAVYEGSMDIADKCTLYASMCQVALTHRHEVLVAPFGTIVNDANAVISTINERFGLGLRPMPIGDVEANVHIADKVRQANTHGDKASSRMGVPDDSRHAAKAMAAAHLRTLPEFQRCRTLYLKLADRDGFLHP